MPYRLLLPASLDLVPADVHGALQAFGAVALADRGCAWKLPEAGAPGVPDDASPVIVRLLPRKAIVVNAGEPVFQVPKRTQRAVEVITPAEEPGAGDCQRIHDCAVALAEALGLGVLNPYRGVFYPSAEAYRLGLQNPSDADSAQVQRWSCVTDRPSGSRTRPANGIQVNRGSKPAAQTAPPQPVRRQGTLERLADWMRGKRRYRLPVPTGTDPSYVQTILRQIRAALPVARVHYNPRRRLILIDAPQTPLVTRTVQELLHRYGNTHPPAGEVRPAHC